MTRSLAGATLTLDKARAIEVLAVELAELFGHLRWEGATEFQKRTWRAEATAILLGVVKAAGI